MDANEYLLQTINSKASGTLGRLLLALATNNAVDHEELIETLENIRDLTFDALTKR